MEKLLVILKWSLAVILFLIAIGLIATGQAFPSLLLALCGVLVAPPIQIKLNTFGLNYWIVAILFIASFVGAIVSIESDSKADKEKSASTIVKNQKEEKEAVEYIPAFVEKGKTSYNANGNKVKAKTEFQILKAENFKNLKFTYDIRLSNYELTKNELKQLALYLKKQLDRKYERIFISYYLPGDVVGSGAWATSHFNPDLNVMIFGISKSSVDELKKNYKEDLEEDVIGTWVMGTNDYAYAIVLFKKDGKVYKSMRDGKDRLDTELIIKNINRQKRFVKKDDNLYGGYYIINSDGELELYDKDGFIEKYIKYKA